MSVVHTKLDGIWGPFFCGRPVPSLPPYHPASSTALYRRQKCALYYLELAVVCICLLVDFLPSIESLGCEFQELRRPTFWPCDSGFHPTIPLLHHLQPFINVKKFFNITWSWSWGDIWLLVDVLASIESRGLDILGHLRPASWRSLAAVSNTNCLNSWASFGEYWL